MDIYQAAEMLQQKLEQFDWLTAVAVGEVDRMDVIYVYLKRAVKSDELDSLKRHGWQGYKVLIERVGSVRPAHA